MDKYEMVDMHEMVEEEDEEETGDEMDINVFKDCKSTE